MGNYGVLEPEFEKHMQGIYDYWFAYLKKIGSEMSISRGLLEKLYIYNLY